MLILLSNILQEFNIFLHFVPLSCNLNYLSLPHLQLSALNYIQVIFSSYFTYLFIYFFD